jgi:hypothetical protein
VSLLVARRRGFRLTEAALICATGVAGYRACVLDSRGDPEVATPAILLTLGLATCLVVCLVVDYLSATPPKPPTAPDSHQVEFGEAAAMVSVVTGVLAWLPVIPLAGPILYAAVATLSGLFALRAVVTGDHRSRQRGMAVLGAAAGVLYIVVWLTRT